MTHRARWGIWLSDASFKGFLMKLRTYNYVWLTVIWIKHILVIIVVSVSEQDEHTGIRRTGCSSCRTGNWCRRGRYRTRRIRARFAIIKLTWAIIYKSYLYWRVHRTLNIFWKTAELTWTIFCTRAIIDSQRIFCGTVFGTSRTVTFVNTFIELLFLNLKTQKYP